MTKSTELLLLCFLSLPSLAVAQTEDAPSCAEGDSAGHSLTDAQLDALVRHVVTRIQASEGVPTFEPAEIEKAIGVAVKPAEAHAVRAAVIEMLKAHPEVIAKLSGSRCQQYDACSLNRNLSGATGEELAMYTREKQEDGVKYSSRELPRYAATTLAGEQIRSDGLVGKLDLPRFCGHSRKRDTRWRSDPWQNANDVSSRRSSRPTRYAS